MILSTTFGNKRLLAAILVAFLLPVVPQLAFAQEDADIEKITLSPSSKTVKADSGSRVTGTLEVHNTGTVAFDFEVYASPYGVRGENYDPEFTESKPNRDVYKWVRFSQTDFSIEPGQKREVNYTLDIPADATPGGHYGVIFAETKARAIGNTGVERQKRVGQVIYATINGNYKSEGKLDNFILPFWQTKPPMISSARVTNTGNVDFETEVKTVAKDMFGRTKYEYTGDPIVLPDTTRLIEMKWEKAPTFGLFNVSQNIKFLGKEHTNNRLVLVAPRWFPVLVLIVVVSGAGYAVVTRRKNNR